MPPSQKPDLQDCVVSFKLPFSLFLFGRIDIRWQELKGLVLFKSFTSWEAWDFLSPYFYKIQD